MSCISGNGALNTKIKKFIFQEGPLKSQANKISYFLRVSKNKFIHSSS